MSKHDTNKRFIESVMKGNKRTAKRYRAREGARERETE